MTLPQASGQPLVSIIIANYNYGRFLGEAIQSALDQTYPAVEVLLVDDGSTDDSLEVASRYPIQVHARNHDGVSATRNFGAAQSRGEFLLFLDADDRYEPRTVATLLAALRAAPASVAYAYCQQQCFGDEDHIYASKVFTPKALISGPFVNICSLIRREAFEALGGWDPTWRNGLEDYELWVRMLHHGWHGMLVPEPLHLYRRHGRSLNDEANRRLVQLRWRLRLTYPGLFWRKLLQHPFDALVQWFRQGRSCRRHGPSD